MSSVLKKPRQRKCRSCGELYQPWKPLQVACSVLCAVAYTHSQAQKRARRDKREGRERLRTLSDWTALTQKTFNVWIRERDKNRPCISCGRFNQVKWNAGHYKPTGSNPELRFDELNAHKQCEHCNSWRSGNLGLYRTALIARIGQEAVDFLEGPHPPKKYTIDDLKAIRLEYRRKIKNSIRASLA